MLSTCLCLKRRTTSWTQWISESSSARNRQCLVLVFPIGCSRELGLLPVVRIAFPTISRRTSLGLIVLIQSMIEKAELLLTAKPHTVLLSLRRRQDLHIQGRRKHFPPVSLSFILGFLRDMGGLDFLRSWRIFFYVSSALPARGARHCCRLSRRSWGYSGVCRL